jgi:hypothetical protein
VKHWTKSIGTLRLNNKTKDRSPDLTGTMKIHRNLINAMSNELDQTGADVVTCNIAAWQYRDDDGPLLNLQLTEPYKPPRRDQGSTTIFDLLTKQQDEDED